MKTKLNGPSLPLYFSVTKRETPLLVVPKVFSSPKILIPNRTREMCLNIPPFVTSHGVWPDSDDRRWWFNNSISLLQLQLILIFSSYALVHFILKRFGVSRITSQIIGGIILGCALRFCEMKGIRIMTTDSEDILGLLGYFGFFLYLFLTAVKMDVTLPMKAGRKSLMIAFPFIFVPMIAGFVAQSFFNKFLTKEEEKMTISLVCYHALTSLSVVSSVISEIEVVNPELNRLCLSATMCSEMVSTIILLIINFINGYQHEYKSGFGQFGVLIIFVLVVVFVFRPAMHWIVKQTPEGKPVRPIYIQGITLVVIVSLSFCSLVSQPLILGPYLLGLVIPDGAPLGSSLEATLECFVLDVLIPIFSGISALRVDIRKVIFSFEATFTKVNIFLLFVVLTFKMITCFLSSLYCNLPFKDSLAMSLLMSCKGIVEIAVYSLFSQRKIIPTEGFLGCLILIAALIATIVPISVKKIYGHKKENNSYENRNIMYLKPDSELRVIACIHHNENISGVIHLLNLSCPTVKNPLAVYVIHLIELIGRTTPIFISHSSNKRTAANDESFSQNVIHSLDHFEKDNFGNVCVECFTSISPTNYMSDDISKLALDKMTSLMILPFHRTWTIDGFMDKDDNIIRALNSNMLDTSPCSVGVFVDRGHLGYAAAKASAELLYKYSVCVIFVGGNDDREALSYARRMIKDSRIELTILTLTSSVGNGSSKWEEMFDFEVLRDLKLECEDDGRTTVTFIEEICEDGPQTALKLREIVNDHDLIVVGRRSKLESPQTSGLGEWSEFPELGILGDLIISFDINYKASVLIIQQQKIKQPSSI